MALMNTENAVTPERAVLEDKDVRELNHVNLSKKTPTLPSPHGYMGGGNSGNYSALWTNALDSDTMAGNRHAESPR